MPPSLTTPGERRKRYFRVKAITDEQGTRPDIPEGVSWAGNTDGEDYLITTPEDLSGLPGVEELTEGESRQFLQHITDLPGEDAVEKWGVG